MKIIGTGSALPSLTVTNDDLATFLDTNDAWITTRTGIQARHLLSNEDLYDLAVDAANKAIQASGLRPDGYVCSNNVIVGIGATLGYGCADNIIHGDRNTVDRGSDHNILAALCDENYIGPGCSQIELGATSTRNYFASGCSEIVLGSSCSDNYFGSGCAKIGFYTSASSETLQNFFVKNIIDAGCSNLRLHSTTVGGVHNVQNYHILSGVSGQSADPLLIELLRDREYCTFVGKKTDGSITITNILDLVP